MFKGIFDQSKKDIVETDERQDVFKIKSDKRYNQYHSVMTALELKTINENLKTDHISDELKEKIDELKYKQQLHQKSKRRFMTLSNVTLAMKKIQSSTSRISHFQRDHNLKEQVISAKDLRELI